MTRRRALGLLGAVAGAGIAGTPSASAASPINGQVEVDLGYYESVQRRAGQDPNLAVSLVLSGGGHRSGNYCAGAMLALETLRRSGGGNDLLAECDYLVSHSAGGFAAGAYLKTLDGHLSRGGDRGNYSFAAALDSRGGSRRALTPREALAADYFVSIKRGLVRDLVPGGATRGEQLQKALDDKLLHGFRFNDAFVAKGEGGAPRLPYWFPYSLVVPNGAIFMHAPDVYRRYGITAIPEGRRMRRLGGEYGSVPASLGLRASMSLPFLVPPCVLESSIDPEKPYIHLRDGALANNVGASASLPILRQDRAKDKLMIVVDANVRFRNPCCDSRSSEGLVSEIYKSVCYGMDANLHRYREKLVSHDIRRDAEGRILRGKTPEGIRVVFLYPELLPEETQHAFGEVGPTLKLKASEQAMLIRAGREVVAAQLDALAWGFGGGLARSPVMAAALPRAYTATIPEPRRRRWVRSKTRKTFNGKGR